MGKYDFDRYDPPGGYSLDDILEEVRLPRGLRQSTLRRKRNGRSLSARSRRRRCSSLPLAQP